MHAREVVQQDARKAISLLDTRTEMMNAGEHLYIFDRIMVNRICVSFLPESLLEYAYQFPVYSLDADAASSEETGNWTILSRLQFI